MINILELQKKAIAEYGTGKTCEEIGNILDIPNYVVSFLLKSADVKLRKRTPKVTKTKIELPLEEIKRLYVEENYRILDLAHKFYVSEKTILLRLHEMGVSIKRITKIQRLNKEEIKKLYLEDKMTSKKIGRRLGCSGTTILNFMRKNNIPIRDPHYKGKIYKKRW